MNDNLLYPKSFVRDSRGPKFQLEAGYSREEVDIPAHCATFGEILESNSEYTTATSLTNINSDKSNTLRCPLTESSRISGSDIIKQTYSMTHLEGFLRMPLSLFEMADRIKVIPSPRKRLFHQLVTTTGLSPNTVKMILCSTTSGIYPKRRIRHKIAEFMGIDVNQLFPADRTQTGSIVDVYLRLSPNGIEFQNFIFLLSLATHSKQKTVRKWLKARKVPMQGARIAIAQVIGVSISQLFPLEEG